MLIDYHERIEIIFMELSQTASNSDHSFFPSSSGPAIPKPKVMFKFPYVYT